MCLNKRIPWEDWRREWQTTPIFLPGEFHGQRSLEGCSPWGLKEADTTEWLTHTHTHTQWEEIWVKRGQEIMVLLKQNKIILWKRKWQTVSKTRDISIMLVDHWQNKVLNEFPLEGISDGCVTWIWAFCREQILRERENLPDTEEYLKRKKKVKYGRKR